MRKRLAAYDEQTSKLIPYYARARARCYTVDGNRAPAEVYAAISASLARYGRSAVIVTKSRAEIEIMREAGRITARALRVVGEAVRPGVTTAELDALAEETIRAAGAVPAFKGYQGFPATICTSVNEQVVHGIPGGRARCARATSSRSTAARSSTATTATRP